MIGFGKEMHRFHRTLDISWHMVNCWRFNCLVYFLSFQPGAKVHPDLLSEIVRPSIDYVRHKKFRSGNFPSSLSNESDRLVHWCHGAPGVVHMLIMAHKVSVQTDRSCANT